MRPLPLSALALTLALLPAADAAAGIVKYRIHSINIQQSPDISPPLRKSDDARDGPLAPFHATFLEDVAGTPVLRKLIFKSHDTVTVLVPGAGGAGATIFIANNYLEGPGPRRKPTSFSGTGSLAGGTVVWGAVTGWTVTGQQWCNSTPPSVCNIADFQHQSTGDPFFFSDFYDLGTWYFHSTGFTATAFVHQYFTAPPGNFGNNMRWVRGFVRLDATVPAVPLIGLALLAGSLALGGALAFGRRRD